METPSAAPRRFWRPLTILAILFGIACHFGAKWLIYDDGNSLPKMPLIMTFMYGPLLAVLFLIAYWLIRGTASCRTRLMVFFLAIGVTAGSIFGYHSTLRIFGPIFAIPITVAAVGLIEVLLPSRSMKSRIVIGVIVAILAYSPWAAFRMKGVTGTFQMDLAYRWEKTDEEIFAEYQKQQGGTNVEIAAVAVAPEDWPGFRGANRDGVSPPNALKGKPFQAPKEIWRHPVGAAWSSVAVVGNAIFTQEQREENEAVVCYDVATGKQLWAYGETDKHFDIAGGAGPRATPTIANGMLFAHGANGQLVCLDAASGKKKWAVRTKSETDADKSVFGISSSPLVVDKLVILHPGYKNVPRLVAYDVETGNEVWKAEAGTHGYCSPQLATIAGVRQILIFNQDGLFGHDIATGKQLWHYVWKADDMSPTVTQPLIVAGDRAIVSGGNVGVGSRSVKVTYNGDKWTATEEWQTTKFSSNFNDYVQTGDHLYGLDNGILCCVELKTGKRLWKEGRFGSGQILLVKDGTLLIQSEKGWVAGVKVTPEGMEELWKIDGLKDKSWNHPVIAGGRLFIRSAAELAAYEW